jgi:hypothetical protein
MTTSTNVSTPSTNNTMLIRWSIGRRAGGHGFALIKHEIPHLLQWPQKHLTQHCARPSFPHHAHNEKSKSP